MNSTTKINVPHYSINEIINILEKKGFDVDLNHIRSCIRENIITPIFYLEIHNKHYEGKATDDEVIKVDDELITALDEWRKSLVLFKKIDTSK